MWFVDVEVHQGVGDQGVENVGCYGYALLFAAEGNIVVHDITKPQDRESAREVEENDGLLLTVEGDASILSRE